MFLFVFSASLAHGVPHNAPVGKAQSDRVDRGRVRSRHGVRPGNFEERREKSVRRHDREHDDETSQQRPQAVQLGGKLRHRPVQSEFVGF